jgi:hypothetical protein
MQSVLEKVKTSEFTCVEVAEIRNRRFLGILYELFVLPIVHVLAWILGEAN